TMAATRLDDIQADLLITVSCIMSSENNILYHFSISAEDKLLLEGRAAVVLNADALALNLGNNA
ncbi:MAG: hydroxymyristoyl-ACP dehydratase, partial [Pseudomonadota bacterium]|nr:hydroxymyristoyl-ACP dehydratase [Pseudomonadota bacterium]